MALAALFILSVAWWLASAYVEHEHAAVVVQWRARLTAMADDRQRAIEGWIAERQDDTSIIANYLTTQYLVAGRRSGPYPFPGDEHSLPRQRQRGRAGVAEGAHRSGHVGTVFVRPSAPARGQLHVQRGAERRGAARWAPAQRVAGRRGCLGVGSASWSYGADAIDHGTPTIRSTPLLAGREVAVSAVRIYRQVKSYRGGT